MRRIVATHTYKQGDVGYIGDGREDYVHHTFVYICDMCGHDIGLRSVFGVLPDTCCKCLKDLCAKCARMIYFPTVGLDDDGYEIIYETRVAACLDHDGPLRKFAEKMIAEHVKLLTLIKTCEAEVQPWAPLPGAKRTGIVEEQKEQA